MIDARRRLVCFTEKQIKDAGESAAPERRECKLRDGDIVNLDVVPTAETGVLTAVATYADGRTIAINNDLMTITDLGRLAIDDVEEYKVEFAGMIDDATARKGLLKNREDVVALIDRLGGSPQLQWRVMATTSSRQFQLLGLRSVSVNAVQSLSRGVALLMSHELSSSPKHKASGQCELHAPSETLYDLTGGKLAIYDLSSGVPKLVTRIGSRSSPITTFARLSSGLVLAAHPETVTIYETHHGSIQASVSLSTTSHSTQSRKRKYADMDVNSVPITLIAAFAELGLAVGTSGSELSAIQLGSSLSGNRNTKSRQMRLADVMGKGSVKEPQKMQKQERQSGAWAKWTAIVDELAATHDIEGLESLVANDSKLGRQRKPHRLKDLEPGVERDDSATYEDLWPLPETVDPQDLDRRKLLYILEKVFVRGEGPNHGLQIAIRSTKLVEWLALTGSLSTASIRQAVRKASQGSSQTHDVAPGSIMAAVHPIDADFQLMHDLLDLPVYWEVQEIVQALRIILQSFNNDSSGEPKLALEAPPAANGDEEVPNGDAESELDVAENELDHAVTALTAGLEVRSDALRSIFARLNTLDSAEVTTTMRSMMSQEELFFLIHILRIELADGGWTSRYVSTGEDVGAEGGMVDALAGMEDSGPNDESIKVIGFLLNCVVDAIGVSGWLVGLGGTWSAKEMVESLRAEVSAGYEGCLEANTVKSFLAEIEMYSRQCQQLPEGYVAEGMHVDGGGQPVLPVGGRAVVPSVKNRNGQVTTKSKIAQAQEKSRSVGKYTFERIRI